MTFLDWSDTETMFGLLVDFVADARADSHGDRERSRFLSDLLTQLRAMEGRFSDVSTSRVLERLQEAHDSVDGEFVDDPVMVHLRDCIDELERAEAGR